MSTDFFSIEEVFIRLGQNRFKGCLIVFNLRDSVHIFVDDGKVICALGDKLSGDAALKYALAMEQGSYTWIAGGVPIIMNLDMSINEYALRHSIARDVQINKTISMPRQATTVLPKEELERRFPRKSLNLDFNYYFTDLEMPTFKIKLPKISNVVGRDESCEVVLTNPQVSRRHCIMQVTERGIMIKDLDSSNGTYANGIAMTDGYISRGDRLSLGSYEMTLYTEQKTGGRFVS